MYRPILATTLLLIATLLALIFQSPQSLAQDPVFSGPQAGEKLPPFKVKGVVGEFAGKEYDPVAAADGKPLLLIFFHEKTRPAFGMCRAIAKYTGGLKSSHDLSTHMVLLTDDPSSEENWAKNVVRRNFPDTLEVSVSPDGQEGPGAYGLNRNVALTVLVGNEGRVTANFALVQPQLQADGPKVLQAIAAVAGGGKIPSLAELDPGYAAREMAGRNGMRNQNSDTPPPGRATQGQQDAKLTGLLRGLINKRATIEDVKQAASDIEAYIATNANAKKELKRIANTVVDSGKLSNYGTEAAQEVLRKWVKQFEKEVSSEKKD